MKVSLAAEGRSVSWARVRVASAAPGRLSTRSSGVSSAARAPWPRWAKTMRPSLSRASTKKASSSGCSASRAESTRSMRKPPSDAGERAGVVGGEAVVVEDGGDGGAERRVGEAAGDPVAEPPVGAVAPHVGVGGEGGVGARVPAVDVDVGEIDHAPGVDGRDRVGAGDVVGVARDRRPRGRPAGSGAA